MFLTEDDYRVVCDEDELDILTRSEPETRQKAERGRYGGGRKLPPSAL